MSDRRQCLVWAHVLFCALAGWRAAPGLAAEAPAGRAFRAGASAVDVTPEKFPVVVNGGFLPAVANGANGKLYARTLVLDDGQTKIALCVVDSCTLPRTLLDPVKQQVQQATGIPADRIMISATHTHSAPAVMNLLGVDADPHYPDFLAKRLAEGITAAAKNLAPAKAGWAAVDAPEFTNCRRWIYRSDRMLTDPFGNLSVRANMHPGYVNPNAVGPAGPIDPGLTLLAVQSADGRPLALLANYSMHYFGAGPVSPDYFGLFASKVEKAIAGDNNAAGAPTFVAAMSQGTSGDLHWMDYSKPQRGLGMDQYAQRLADRAIEAYKSVAFRDSVTVAMREKDVRLNVRAPDAQRLAWAKPIYEKMKAANRGPNGLPEVYAREAMLLHENPTRDVKLQAIRIGDLGIAAIPCEVYGITGLKLKARSPLRPHFNIELANDEVGYIPPPEQHTLGGYTTWPARSAALEVGAEPVIVETLLGLLEEVAGKPRRNDPDPHGPYARAVIDAKPLAYWRLNGLEGPKAADAAEGAKHPAAFEPRVAFGLEGPASPGFSGEGAINRAAHFAGGRMAAELKDLGPNYTVEFWFWNGFPPEGRDIAGYLFSRGPGSEKKEALGDHLGIGGTYAAQGRLFFFNGDAHKAVLAGNTVLGLKTWNHVVLARAGKKVNVYLNGNEEPEISGEAEPGYPASGEGQLFFGGRNDNFANLEGKLDEIAVYNRALTAGEAAAHFKLSGLPAKPNARAPKPATAMEPADSQKTIRVPEGYEVELVAAEPLVIDPVAVAWGPDGKLWVAEMHDYPLGLDGNGKPGGRIKFLEDADGDGKYDKATVLLDGVNFPNGVMPWRKGVIVTAAPEIFYAEDADGDGKADKREVLFGGFTEGNQQLRINGLRWGLDNWVYVANGLSSEGNVKSAKTGQAMNIKGRDMRFRPDEGLMDAEAGASQFGRNRDEWGEWFGEMNPNPLWHYPLSERYARRNPHFAPPDLRRHVLLQNAEDNAVHAISVVADRYAIPQQGGRFTSACSATVYGDDVLFPREPGRQHAFTCEPVHNLVHHRVISDAGVTFTARRPDTELDREFIAAEDPWFRPVMVRTGPEGALWVVDMYRHTVEHPQWIAPENRPKWAPFLRLGDDRGRLWRVIPKGKKLRAAPRLDKLDTEQLVAALDSESSWQRDTAQQVLLWRNDAAAAPALEKLLATSKNPLARLHALCTLDGLNALKPETITRAMKDEHPGVRRHAVRLAEPRAKDAPQLVEAAAALASDPDARVRLQLACSAGEWDGPRAGEALAKLAMTAGDDPHFNAAVMSSVPRHFETVAAAVATAGGENGPLLRELLGMALARGGRPAMAKLVEPLVKPGEGGRYAAEQMRGLGQWMDALALRNTSAAQLIAAAPQDALGQNLAAAGKVVEAARAVVADADRPAEERAAAADLLGRDPAARAADVQKLAALLVPQSPAEVQKAAVRALGRTGEAAVPDLVLKNWAGHSPEVRGAVADALAAREPWAVAMLKAVEAKKVSPADLDAARRERLLRHPAAGVKALAGKLLGADSAAAGGAAGNRGKVVEAHAGVLGMKGDAARGAAAFARNCAVCHRLGEVGTDIGPNLGSVAGWAPELLLTAILDPNRAVEPRFLAYEATLANDEVVYGVITSETGNGITMKGLDGKEVRILRNQIKSLTSTNRSLMPDGLEAALKDPDLADVIAYVRTPAGAK